MPRFRTGVFWIVVTLWWGPLAPDARAQAEATVAQELTRIEQQLAATWKKGDCDGWGAFIAPEWSVTHINGAVIAKTEALAMCRAPSAPIETFEIDDLSVRVYGAAAVVTGRTTVAVGGKEPGTVKLRFTDVFIRRAGRWQVVSSHASPLAGGP
jgi:hypothetical protein